LCVIAHNIPNVTLCVITYKYFLKENKSLKTIVEKVSSVLKSLRQDKGWSLDVTSEKTGVSKAMLGQIERGESSPTIATLWKIASGFDVSFSSFVEELKPAGTALFHRSGDLKQMHPQDDKIRVMVLFAYDELLKFETYIIELLPGCEHISPPHQHGVIEHVVVSRGEMEVLVGGQWHKLKQNEGLRFNADQPHGYRNLGGEKAIFHDMIHYTAKDLSQK
jgi:transcriptional regulator with XRE-family HTH domain